MARTRYDMPADLDVLLTRANYPGMIPEESRPLREFLRRHGARFGELRFDVRLGPGGVLPDGFDDPTRRAWSHVTKMRPDLVALTDPNQVAIIEAKQVFGNDGVWQLLAYRDAYVEQAPEAQVRLIGVAEDAGIATRTLAERSGIGLYLYAFAPGAPDIAAPATEVAPDGV